jgi:hypothetical protein
MKKSMARWLIVCWVVVVVLMLAIFIAYGFNKGNIVTALILIVAAALLTGIAFELKYDE